MNWNNHSNLEGKHAVLSPSQSSWLRYSEDKVYDSLVSNYAQTVGTLLHEFAAYHIKYNIKLNKSSKQEALLYLLMRGVPHYAVDMDFVFPNLMTYVNDAIGYKMSPEVLLYYSDNCFGTTDAINFRQDFLRIHDLKTGRGPVKMEQLMVYAALFCLEYKIKPSTIDIELRIYQSGSEEVLYHNPGVDEIVPIIDTIITTDKLINKIKEEES